jgi:uncharacterized repeat protein (TIGR02543 family)
VKFGYKSKSALVAVLFGTLLTSSFSPLPATAAVPTPLFGIYMDAPFVQGSYASSATTTTEEFNTTGSVREECPGSSNVNNYRTLADGTLLKYACTLFEANTAYSASTTSSAPTVGGTPTQFLTSWNASGAGYASYLFTFANPQKYIGFWWAAGSTGNNVEFYNGGTLVASLNVNQVVSMLGNFPADYSADTKTVSSLAGSEYKTKYYFGNPQGYSSLTPTAPTANVGYAYNEPFVYIHAFAGENVTFTQVQFNGTGFEIDNLTKSQTAISVNNRLVSVQNLYAPGVTVYSLAFDGNGGSYTQGIDYSSNDQINLPAAPTKSGYNFAGWKRPDNSILGASSPFNPPDGGETLQAQWTAKTLTVTYDSQGGSGVSNGSTVTAGSISLSPGSPAQPGYSFAGWFANSTGGSALSFPYTHGRTANFSLYAQWNWVARATSTEIQIDPSALTDTGAVTQGAAIRIGGRATDNTTTNAVPDSAGKYSFSYVDADNVSHAIANCQNLSTTNGLSFCSSTVPSGFTPIKFYATFISNDETLYLGSENNSGSLISIGTSSGGGGGGGGGGAPIYIPPITPLLPGMNWTPADIREGEAINSDQLNATFTVPGVARYSVQEGFKPKSGTFEIKVTFTPSDTTNYLVSESTRTITVFASQSQSEISETSDDKSKISVENISLESLKILKKISFHTNEYFLDAYDRKVLKALAEDSNVRNMKALLVYGHTDAMKGVDNQWLSKSRAQAVATYLRKYNLEVSVTTAWFGPSKPLTLLRDKKSLKQNRRVEIFLVS